MSPLKSPKELQEVEQIDERIRKLKKSLRERSTRISMVEQPNALSGQSPYERLYEIANMLLSCEIDDLESACLLYTSPSPRDS